MKHEIIWTIDVAKIIQALGMLILLIYGMYQGYNKVDDFLDLREVEIGIAQMEAETNSMRVSAQAGAAPCICGAEDGGS